MKRTYLDFNRRILITGGAGFLGSHLSDRLLKEGNEVICLDNFFTGSKVNISHLLYHPHFEIMRHDVTFPLYIGGSDLQFSLPGIANSLST